MIYMFSQHSTWVYYTGKMRPIALVTINFLSHSILIQQLYTLHFLSFLGPNVSSKTLCSDFYPKLQHALANETATASIWIRVCHFWATNTHKWACGCIPEVGKYCRYWWLIHECFVPLCEQIPGHDNLSQSILTYVWNSIEGDKTNKQ